jgi:hypothetical protein
MCFCARNGCVRFQVDLPSLTWWACLHLHLQLQGACSCFCGQRTNVLQTDSIYSGLVPALPAATVPLRVRPRAPDLHQRLLVNQQPAQPGPICLPQFMLRLLLRTPFSPPVGVMIFTEPLAGSSITASGLAAQSLLNWSELAAAGADGWPADHTAPQGQSGRPGCCSAG